MDETIVLASIRDGNTEQFGLLYDAYFDRIYRYHFFRTRNKKAAEDLTSTTFLKAVEHIHSFNERKGTFSSWIYRIARNALFDHFRAGRNDASLEGEMIDPPSHEDIEQHAAHKALLAHVADSLAALPASQREVITLRIWDDLSYREIAEILGKSEASCKMGLSRGLRELKRSTNHS